MKNDRLTYDHNEETGKYNVYLDGKLQATVPTYGAVAAVSQQIHDSLPPEDYQFDMEDDEDIGPAWTPDVDTPEALLLDEVCFVATTTFERILIAVALRPITGPTSTPTLDHIMWRGGSLWCSKFKPMGRRVVPISMLLEHASRGFPGLAGAIRRHKSTPGA